MQQSIEEEHTMAETGMHKEVEAVHRPTTK